MALEQRQGVACIQVRHYRRGDVMSTQPPRKDYGGFDNRMRGLGRGTGSFLRWFWALRWKVKGPVIGVLTLLLFVAIGSAGGGDNKTEKAFVGSETTPAGEAKTATTTNPPKATDTARPASTPKPSDTAAAATVPPTSAAAATNAPAPTNTTASQPATPTPQPATVVPATPVPPTIPPAPTATSVPVGFSLPACYVAGQDRCNCSHFSTQAYAQWFHNNYDPPDVNKLDQNNDGVVCESNR